ncbi:hypothetical protein ACIBF7_23080 [Nonomuraea sp. NPDC050478]|uniref:hypothetical protein n=1 Tax=Nonomuraea sp. NPDC050478 TaxID=3364365 RepID=UPI00379D5EBB
MRTAFIVALATLALLAGACTPETNDASESSPALEPVIDSSPYICMLIPEHAFRIASDFAEPLVERTSGNERNGNCRAPDSDAQALDVWWMKEGPGMPSEHLDFLMNDRRKVYSRYGGVALSTDLGDGMAAYMPDPPINDQPYRVSAKFRCGDKQRLIDISLPKITKGRDAMKDLTDLMRIAQNRYAEIHNCELNTK